MPYGIVYEGPLKTIWMGGPVRPRDREPTCAGPGAAVDSVDRGDHLDFDDQRLRQVPATPRACSPAGLPEDAGKRGEAQQGGCPVTGGSD